MKIKVTLIVLAILGAVGAAMLLMMHGIEVNNRERGELVVPSEEAAIAYAIENGLLEQVTSTTIIRPSVLMFRQVSGTDAEGRETLVWLIGRDDDIQLSGKVAVEEAIAKEAIMEKLPDIRIPLDKIKEMYLAPVDRTSQRIAWFVEEKSSRGHMAWFHYQTGELIWELYVDPAAWDP